MRKEYKKLISETPIELSSTFAMKSVNEAIPLFEDSRLSLVDGGSTCFRGEGSVLFEWLPSPAIRFHATSNRNDDVTLLPGQCKLVLTSPRRSVDVIVTEKKLPWESEGQISGLVTDDPLPNRKKPIEVSFVLPNFKTDMGQMIRDDSGQLFRKVRHEFYAEDWIITVDELPEYDGEHKKELRSTGGYMITHVGHIRQSDYSAFAIRELEQLIDDLYWFFSFYRGFRTGPVLIELTYKRSRKRWLNMMCPTLDRWQLRQQWFDKSGSGSLEAAFPGYIRRIRKKIWTKPIQLSIHWYLEACSQAGAIEGSIVFTQTALEMLGWTLLVDDKKVISAEGYEKIPASDKIRLLLSMCNVSLRIPSSLANLRRTATREKWQDGARCITEIRNAVIHGKRKKREKLAKLPFESIQESYSLSISYLERVLLWLFDYTGKYVATPK